MNHIRAIMAFERLPSGFPRAVRSPEDCMPSEEERAWFQQVRRAWIEQVDRFLAEREATAEVELTVFFFPRNEDRLVGFIVTWRQGR